MPSKTRNSNRIVMPPPVATATVKSAHVTAMAANATVASAGIVVNALRATTRPLRWNTVQPAANPMHL